jgi:hypothetical protein
MASETDAYRLVASVLRRPHDDGESPWQLLEFPQGWLVKEENKDRGSTTRVVERDSGRVLRFPSFVPPGRILRDYPAVVDKGRVEIDPMRGQGSSVIDD